MWTADQLQAITERRAELAVSAAAGSGKTAVLIERVLRTRDPAGVRVGGMDGVLVRLGRILDNSFNEIYIFDAQTYRFSQISQGALNTTDNRRKHGVGQIGYEYANRVCSPGAET